MDSILLVVGSAKARVVHEEPDVEAGDLELGVLLLGTAARIHDLEGWAQSIDGLRCVDAGSKFRRCEAPDSGTHAGSEKVLLDFNPVVDSNG